jgi:hypothetical protein
MSKTLAIIGAILGVVVMIVLLIALAFGLEVGSLKWKGYFAPKHEAVRREVFKETRSYNEAKLQQLAKYRLEYIRAKDPEEKEALASTIRMMFADYDDEKLPSELRSFLKQIKYGE